MPQILNGNTLQFLYKEYHNFWNYFKKHLIKIYTNTHHIAPFFKILSEDLLNPVMYAHLLGMTTYELRLATDCPHNNGVFRTMIFFN